MTHLALDLSKRSAGWAVWTDGLDIPFCGSWQLGDELTVPGRTFCRLHARLDEVNKDYPLRSVTYEKPLNLGIGVAQTTEETLFVLIGLAAHVDSYCTARGIPICRGVHQATWRRAFVGKIPRGTHSRDIKDLCLARCKQFGFRTKGNHDAAEAAGVLDYALCLEGIMPPWREKNILLAPLV
jgi:hypothetical protein